MQRLHKHDIDLTFRVTNQEHYLTSGYQSDVPRVAAENENLEPVPFMIAPIA
jgi:hypothetical protein